MPSKKDAAAKAAKKAERAQRNKENFITTKTAKERTNYQVEGMFLGALLFSLAGSFADQMGFGLAAGAVIGLIIGHFIKRDPESANATDAMPWHKKKEDDK